MSLYVYRCPRCPTHVSLQENPLGPRSGATPHCLSHGGEYVAMLPMADDTRAVLPFDRQSQLAPMRVDSLKEAGILTPETQHALEWMYRHRARNGMAEAFLKVAGRRCIDLVAFARLMRGMRA